MQETDLVLELIEELSKRQCNGHACVRLGTGIADPQKFLEIYDRYATGTYFEQVDLELQTVAPEIQCSCSSIDKRVETPEELSETCPHCGEVPKLVHGTEFDILEPEPVDEY